MADTHWSRERYLLAKAFDGMVRYQIELAEGLAEKFHNPVTGVKERELEKIVANYPPETIAMWTAWKNHMATGVMDCPEWCDACEGSGWIVSDWVKDSGKNAFASKCPLCGQRRKMEET
jgi:hypothetical protein